MPPHGKTIALGFGKNARLLHEHGLSFEHITVAVETGGLVQIVPHPNPSIYPRQSIIIVVHKGYAWLVPFVEEDEYYFLKTIIPSRKVTRDYITNQGASHET